LGRKVHPFGFRLGIIRDWQAKWYADKPYADFLQEDFKLRNAIKSRYTEAGISLVQIERQANEVSITIHTARPGIVIGRGGQRVDEIRLYLEKLIGKRVRLNIQEIRQAELDAFLVARTVADQMVHRVAYRRAMKQAMFRTMQAGAKGIRIICGGRLAGAEIARREAMHEGRVPLNTLRADIDYGFTEASTTMGRIGVKVWIYKGDILPERKEEEEVEEKPAEVAAEATAAPPAEVAAPVEAAAKPEVAEAAVPPAATQVAAKKPEVSEAAPAKAEVAEKKPRTKPSVSEAAETAKAEVTGKKPRSKPVVSEPAEAAKAEVAGKKPRAAKPAVTEAAEPAKAETAEKKPARPRVRKPKTATAAEAKAGEQTKTEAATVEKEDKDVTTQAG